MKKLAWETTQEHSYRMKLTKISGKLYKALVAIETVAKTLDCREVSRLIGECNKLIASVKTVPSMYEKSHALLLQAIGAYSTSIDIMVVSIPKNDAGAIYRAARYINEGNSYITLTKSKMWEAIETKGGHSGETGEEVVRSQGS